MSFSKITQDLNIIAALSDTPNETEGLTAAQLKAKFDEAANAIKTYINTVLTAELEAQAASGSIGTAPFTTAAGTVVSATDLLSALEEIQTNIDNIQSGVVGDGSITTAKLADGAVTAVKMADGAVTGSKIGENAVNTSKIAEKAVNTSKIADGAVTADQLASAAVTAAKLGVNAVTAAALADGAVTGGKLGALAVTGGKIAAGAVTNDKLADGTVAREKLTFLRLLPATDYFATEEARNAAYPSPLLGQITWIKA